MAQAILGDSFPPEKRGLAFALYGITSSALQPLVRRWEVGSPTTTLGAGFSTSTFQLAPWHSHWSISLSKIHLT